MSHYFSTILYYIGKPLYNSFCLIAKWTSFIQHHNKSLILHLFIFWWTPKHTIFATMSCKAVAESGILVRFFYDGTKHFEVAQEKCPKSSLHIKNFYLTVEIFNKINRSKQLPFYLHIHRNKQLSLSLSRKHGSLKIKYVESDFQLVSSTAWYFHSFQSLLRRQRLLECNNQNFILLISL